MSPAPRRSKRRKVERVGDGVEVDEQVTWIASFTATEVRARQCPSATGLTSGLPAESSGLDSQDAVGEPGHSEGEPGHGEGEPGYGEGELGYARGSQGTARGTKRLR